MSIIQKPALRNAIERHEHICQKSPVSGHIIDADCCHEENAFVLFSLPRKLPGLFTVRFTAPADFTPGDTINVKGQEFAIRTRTMEEPEGSVFSAGAVVQCDIDMERDLAFFAMPGEATALSGGGGGGSGTFIGKIEFLPNRPGEMPFGYYVCDNTRYPAASPQGTVLLGLSPGYREDWGITLTAEGVNVPNFFDETGNGYPVLTVNGITNKPGLLFAKGASSPVPGTDDGSNPFASADSNVAVITASGSGNFNNKPGDKIRLRAGGGGGGGGTNADGGLGGPGGGGGTVDYEIILETENAAYSCVIGAGGAGGWSSGGKETSITIEGKTYTAGGGGAGSWGEDNQGSNTPRGGGGGGSSGDGQTPNDNGHNYNYGGNGGGTDGGRGGGRDGNPSVNGEPGVGSTGGVVSGSVGGSSLGGGKGGSVTQAGSPGKIQYISAQSKHNAVGMVPAVFLGV